MAGAQRVLNDFLWIRLSRGYDLAQIQHLSPSLLPLSLLLSLPVCCRPSLLWGEGVGEGQIMRLRESLVLYKSFNTLWENGEREAILPR